MWFLVILVLLLLVAVVMLGATVRSLGIRLASVEGQTDVGGATPWADLTLPEAASAQFAASTGFVVFLSSTCLACREVVEQLAASDETLRTTIFIVSELGLATEFRDLIDLEVTSVATFGVQVTPFIMKVRDGRITSALASADLTPLGIANPTTSV